ncbi:hypothetical protein SD78_2813 [Bacillus badius]|nr:hypothetical protein SD78_2813 [Bacillus badius]
MEGAKTPADPAESEAPGMESNSPHLQAKEKDCGPQLQFSLSLSTV